jgi:hypothetical protein
MAKVKSISEWRYIFLDTSVVIDLFQNPDRLEKNPKHQKRVLDTLKLFQYFEKSKEVKKKNYVFYISAITVSELTADLEIDLLEILLEIFKSGELTFVDFTKEIAFSISKNVREFVPKYSYNQLIKYLENNLKNENSITNSRNWIEDDLKIACSAQLLRKLDIVLTADEKTFSPICENLDIPYQKTSHLPKDMFDDINDKL